MRKRFVQLLIKLISVKGLVFVIATVLMSFKLLTVEAWCFFAAGFCGIRAIEKFVRKGGDNA